LRRFQLFLQRLLLCVARTAEQKTVNPLKIALYAFLPCYRLDCVYRRTVTLGSKARLLLSVLFLDAVISIVKGAGDVRRRSARLATAEVAVVYHCDFFARSGKEVCGSKPCNPSSNHNYVYRLRFAGKSLKFHRWGAGKP
jgi:hypothetical protein